MQPDNWGEVSQLIREGQVNSKTSFGVTVIQHAALEYKVSIGKAGSTREAQQLRYKWSRTISALLGTHRVIITRVTREGWFSDNIPRVLDIYVDIMLHELGYQTSEIAADKGLKRYLEPLVNAVIVIGSTS
jgi:hypothetical protein